MYFNLPIIKSPSEDISIRNSDIYYINPGEKSFFYTPHETICKNGTKII